jgi:hypothetical protein
MKSGRFCKIHKYEFCMQGQDQDKICRFGNRLRRPNARQIERRACDPGDRGQEFGLLAVGANQT